MREGERGESQRMRERERGEWERARVRERERREGETEREKSWVQSLDFLLYLGFLVHWNQYLNINMTVSGAGGSAVGQGTERGTQS